MGTITRPNSFVAGNTIIASEVNDDLNTIYNEFNGNISNDNVDAAAAIAASKISFGTTVWVRSVLSLATSDISAGTGKDEFTVPATIPSGKWVIESVEVEVDTAPGSSKTLTIDVNKAGTTILSSAISVSNSTILSTGNTPSVTALSAGDRITMDIDTATSGLSTTRARANLIIKHYLQS